MITRRRVLGKVLGGMGALAGVAAMPGWLRAEVDLGGPRLATLSDGYLELPTSFVLPENTQGRDALLAEFGLTGPLVRSACNVTLLRDGDRVVLFDAGAGSGFMATAGGLVDALAAEGLEPGDITDLVFTHGHPDHLWGVLDDFDDPLFGNARLFMGAAEHRYWTDPATPERIGEARASFAAGAARRLEVLGDHVALIADGDEPVPGVVALASPGHTPGHMSFLVHGQAMVIGDAIGNGHLAFARPGLPSGADQDVDGGIATRLRLLERLAVEELTCIGFHLPEGGIGRVVRTDGAYRFVPA